MYDLPHWFDWERFDSLSTKMADANGCTNTASLTPGERREWRRMRRLLDEIDAGLHGTSRTW